MWINRRWALVAGTVLVSGALLTGAALASGSGAKPTAAQTETNRTPGESEVQKQLSDLRQRHFTQMRDEAKAIIDQAVKDGKLTQEQADKMTNRFAHPWGQRKSKMPHNLKGLTQDELKAKLDAAVKNGKMTQEQADKLMQRWTERQSKQG